MHSRKYPFPPHGRLMEILKGRGISKAQIFKGRYQAKLEFPGGHTGVRFKLKTFHGRGMVTSGTTQYNFTLITRSVYCIRDNTHSSLNTDITESTEKGVISHTLKNLTYCFNIATQSILKCLMKYSIIRKHIFHFWK